MTEFEARNLHYLSRIDNKLEGVIWVILIQSAALVVTSLIVLFL